MSEAKPLTKARITRRTSFAEPASFATVRILLHKCFPLGQPHLDAASRSGLPHTREMSALQRHIVVTP